MTFTPIGQCTANFVFFQGSDEYIGQAAHCAGTGSETDTDGCSSGSLPLGTKVDVDGATKQGTMVYSSWLAMQKAHETDAATCAFNDFALVKLDPADYGRVNPDHPALGWPHRREPRRAAPASPAPTASATPSCGAGSAPSSPRFGFSLGDDDSGWSHSTYQILPGIPGDSGSALLDSNGMAVGILSTIEFAPLPASNQFADVYKTLQYAHHHGFPKLLLALGTVGFDQSSAAVGLTSSAQRPVCATRGLRPLRITPDASRYRCGAVLGGLPCWVDEVRGVRAGRVPRICRWRHWAARRRSRWPRCRRWPVWPGAPRWAGPRWCPDRCGPTSLPIPSSMQLSGRKLAAARHDLS